jgi:hypothetical protein
MHILVEHDGLSAAIMDHALSDGDSTDLCARLKERGIPYLSYSGYALQVRSMSAMAARQASDCSSSRSRPRSHSHDFVPGFRGEARGLGESSFFPVQLLLLPSVVIQAPISRPHQGEMLPFTLG